MVLRAEATRLAKIKEAEGEAEALLTVQKALADSIQMLNQAAPTDPIIRLKALEAFAKGSGRQGDQDHQSRRRSRDWQVWPRGLKEVLTNDAAEGMKSK